MIYHKAYLNYCLGSHHLVHHVFFQVAGHRSSSNRILNNESNLGVLSTRL